MICFCNSNIPWGGGEKWHLEAALAMAARGRRAMVLCHPEGALYERASREPSLETRAVTISSLSFLSPFMRRRLTGLFRKEGVEAVIMNLPRDVKCAGPAANSAGVRHVIYRRGSALPVRDSLLNRHLFGSVITRLIVNSEETRRMALHNNPHLIPPERITLLPNGIDAPAFDAALAAAAPLALPGPVPGGSRPFVLGNAGRLNTQKGQHLFLQLGAALTHEKKCDVRLILAGSGERERELRDLADRLGIADRTLFTGFMEDLSPFWRTIDAFVLTSLWEGFGYVLLEAMLAEKPLLAFAVSNIPELVKHGENGLLFPLPPDAGYPRRDVAPGPGHSAAGAGMLPMAEAVLALGKDAPARQRMGAAGRAFALAHFDKEPLMDRLDGLLRGSP